jgi:hypothetical protein
MVPKAVCSLAMCGLADDRIACGEWGFSEIKSPVPLLACLPFFDFGG